VGIQRNAFITVTVGYELGQRRWEKPGPDRGFGEDQVDSFPGHRKRGGDLAADESASDDGEAMTGPGQAVELPEVGERSESDDPIAGRRQLSWADPRRQQQLVERERVALVVEKAILVQLDPFDPAPKVQIDPAVSSVQPDLIEGFARPKPF
jgi:hypothetical protein